MIARSPVLTNVQPRERRRTPARVRRRNDLAVAAACVLAALTASFGLHLLSGVIAVRPSATATRVAHHRAASAAPIRRDSDGTFGFDLAAYDATKAPALGLHARTAIAVDPASHRVLYAQGAAVRRPLASLTKLTTAMVALDAANPGTVVTVTGNAATADPSKMGVSAGERLTVQELLYGTLLDSGNDAAEALADGLMPRDRFIALMNAKAQALHLRDTHFVSPSGLVDEGNYSSAYDLAVVAVEVIYRYPEIARIANLKDVVIPATADHKAFYPHNRNHILDIYPGADGLKTGFTDGAGGCIVATAVRNGQRVVVVLMGSDIMFGDATRLLDFGFSQV